MSKEEFLYEYLIRYNKKERELKKSNYFTGNVASSWIAYDNKEDKSALIF